MDVISRCSADVIRFTRMGREIASVLPAAPDEEYFERAGRVLSKIDPETISVDWKRDSEQEWQDFVHP
jgi:hypothetical protein